MKSISSSAASDALPPTTADINVNFCKNPKCANFGVPAVVVKHRHIHGTPLASTPGSAYTIKSNGKNRPSLLCLFCKESVSIKSNLAVAEELARFTRYFKVGAYCPSEDCTNNSVSTETPGAYHRFGKTAVGTQRYRCRLCGKTIAVGGPALKRQRITHHNKDILLALTNGVAIRRIAKIYEINHAMLYGKFDFLHRQCLAFAAAREVSLKTMHAHRMYISVDRQQYVVNWNNGSDRRNVRISAVGSADNETGYVFGMHSNFDEDMKPKTVEVDAVRCGELEIAYPYRKYARLWLEGDYQAALAESLAEKGRTATRNQRAPIPTVMNDVIEDAYEAVAVREDSEVSDLKNEDEKLPDANGMQVHDEYSLYGHFQFLKALLPQVEKLRFFLDQDSGMRAACFSAFSDDIKNRRVDAFFIRTKKTQTIDKKLGLINESRRVFKAYKRANPGLTDNEIKVLLMKAEIAKATKQGPWLDQWCSHPWPNMSEPSKAMCWLTNMGDYDADHEAHLYLKVSLAAIDNFFQRVRRGLSPLERPIASASKDRRMWHGYSPYNPAMVQKLLDIYRVVTNYTEVGKDKMTPAMRLGLAKGVVKPEDIIYFTTSSKAKDSKSKISSV